VGQHPPGLGFDLVCAKTLLDYNRATLAGQADQTPHYVELSAITER